VWFRIKRLGDIMKKLTISILFVLAVAISFVSNADMVLEINFPTIISHSQIVFRGVFEESEPVELPGKLFVTKNKFRVIDIIKGEDEILKQGSKEYLEFYQYGLSKKESQKRGMSFAVNFPEFKPGSELVICLSKLSEKPLAGDVRVRDILGFSQGVFNVEYDADGKANIVNSFSNKNLFKNLPKSQGVSKVLKAGNIDVSNPPSGPISYDSFKAMVKEMN